MISMHICARIFYQQIIAQFFFYLFTKSVCFHFAHSQESELDEDSNDEDHVHDPHTPQPGVDDGFFVGTRTPNNNGVDPEKAIPKHGDGGNRGHHPPQEDWSNNFPFAPGLNPSVVSLTHSYLSMQLQS